MGANPHLVKNIEQPLMDRLQLGASCYVTNEIDRNLTTERKLYVFLEYYRKSKGGKQFTKGAMDALLEISSKLAEGKNRIEISRRYLSMVDTALDSANKDKSQYVTKEDVIKALKNTKSIIEQSLEVKINEHYKTSEMETKDKKVGVVKVLGYLMDKYMIEHNNADIKRSLEEENGLAYVSEISATISDSKWSGTKQNGLKIILPEKLKGKKEQLEEKLSLLLEHKIDLLNYRAIVDLSKVLEDDDALVPAMYSAIISAYHNQPLKQDVAVSASCDVEGKLLPVSKVNKRMYTSPDFITSAIVSPHDFNEKLSMNLKIGPEVYKAENIQDLYGVLSE